MVRAIGMSASGTALDHLYPEWLSKAVRKSLK